MRDLRTQLIYLLNLELHEECSRTLGWNPVWARLQRDACNRGAAVEADAIGEQQLVADANGEQQLKQMQSGPGAAADSMQTQAASSS